jgi:hypothetical protein
MPRKKAKPPAPPADQPNDPEEIRDSLLGTIALRAKALRSFAEKATPDGIIGWTDDTPPKPIMFPAYEVQAYMAAVSNITGADLRELRELGKMTPAALDAAVAARKRLYDAQRGIVEPPAKPAPAPAGAVS